MEAIICCICGRLIPDKKYFEKHHLVPVSKKGKKKDVIVVCVDCGDQIHELFSLNELKRSYNTLEALLLDNKVQKWIHWIRKQKKFGVCMKRKKRKKR